MGELKRASRATSLKQWGAGPPYLKGKGPLFPTSSQGGIQLNISALIQMWPCEGLNSLNLSSNDNF